MIFLLKVVVVDQFTPGYQFTFVIYCLTVIVLDKFRGGHELVPGRELVRHHYR